LASRTVPGVRRQPRKKLSANRSELLTLIERWRAEAVKAGHAIKRIVVAFEAGRDGFWLAQWLASAASRPT
jgi:transposase